jgi:Flp pilus assembly protein TadG
MDRMQSLAAGAGPRRSTPAARRVRGQRGAVTAETVMVLPVLAALTLVLAWLVTIGAAQVRVVDAAREVARAVARDEPRPAALARGRQIAPAGATISITEAGGEVRVRVGADLPGPPGRLLRVAGAALHADAVTAQEQP